MDGGVRALQGGRHRHALAQALRATAGARAVNNAKALRDQRRLRDGANEVK